MFPRLTSTLTTLLFSASIAFAADQKSPVFTDPAEAGPDFQTQGEYAGTEAGAQVIALGDGLFLIVGWSPMLPGGTVTSTIVGKVEAKREGDKVAFDTEKWKGYFEGETLHVTNKEDDQTMQLKKTERRSPTLGAKPPEGAVVLFDGTNTDAWRNGKTDANGDLMAGTVTTEAFGDCTIHLEFRTPFKPKARGQERGNSGVYVQDRYEVQILDSFGLAGENNECGGIYSVAKPRVNMCFPPLSWQTYDIDFQAAKFDASGNKTESARLTVRHNGVLIHDRVEVPKATTAAGRKEGPEPGPIQLQNHGNPVVFRNIWLKPATPAPARD